MPILLKTTFYGCTVLTTLAASLHQPRIGKASLALSLNIPPTVNSVSDFTITGTLKNEGTQDILVVKDPSGILYDFFTPDALDFERVDAKATDSDAIRKPAFAGYRAKWDMETYLYDGEEDTDLPNRQEDSGVSEPLEADSDGSDSSSESYPLSDTASSIGGSSNAGDNKRYVRGTTFNLPAGKTIPFKVDNAYDFRKSGAGTYTIKLKRDYFYVLIDGAISIAKVDVNMKKVKIQGKLTANIPKPNDDVSDTNSEDNATGLKGLSIVERAKSNVTTLNCGRVQAAHVGLAAKHANIYASESNDYISAMTGPTERYKHWFGEWNTEPKAPYKWRPRDQVAAMYKSLSEHSFLDPGDAGGYTYDCGCQRSLMGYVLVRIDLQPPDAEDPAIIFLCKGFRRKRTPMTGVNSKAGTLIHEATHITYHNVPGDDHRSTMPKCEILASENPFLAATNSNNFEYFSENVLGLA